MKWFTIPFVVVILIFGCSGIKTQKILLHKMCLSKNESPSNSLNVGQDKESVTAYILLEYKMVLEAIYKGTDKEVKIENGCIIINN